MINIQYIRDNPEIVKEKSEQKGYKVDVDRLLELDKKRKASLVSVEELRAKRNELASSTKNKKPDAKQISQGKDIKERLNKLENELSKIETQWLELLKSIPNMPADDVPVGASESENVVVEEWGTKPKFDFEPKNHAQIAEEKLWLDKERAAKVSGSRFAYVKGDLALLHWALMQYAVTQLTDEKVIAKIVKAKNLKVSTKPFLPVLPPLMIKTQMYDAMDRLEPQEDRYKIDKEELWLQGSAEHVLGSMHADEILEEAEFPIRYLGYATSFRREAGSYGKDMEGIFRLHQFDKLEMESLCLPENSLDEHYLMIAIQVHLMQELKLPYQIINKCTADIGKPNCRGIDINVWLPAQKQYRETHTADFMSDYQARRLQTKLRRKSGDLELVHTNDATAFSQRPLIAIIENNQQKDGSVKVPEVLKTYMGGRETI